MFWKRTSKSKEVESQGPSPVLQTHSLHRFKDFTNNKVRHRAEQALTVTKITNDLHDLHAVRKNDVPSDSSDYETEEDNDGDSVTKTDANGEE